MKNIFNMEGPFISFLSKATDLVVLNLLYMICSIPVITIGASTTALYYVTLRMSRNEEGYIIKDFFRSFKENFGQATVIWLILLCIGSVIGGEFFLINNMEGTLAFAVECIVFLSILLFAFEMLYVFPVLSRFENTVKNTMKNALFISILQIPKTLLMLVFSCFPIVLVIVSLRWLPLFVALGFSVTSYTNACWMDKIFKKFEPEEPEEEKDS
ncbi:MAG: YesL family protein [Lachnospiraceae bacterium]|nr:YesL family protein [Lachnospiraceae bacterium]